AGGIGQDALQDLDRPAPGLHLLDRRLQRRLGGIDPVVQHEEHVRHARAASRTTPGFPWRRRCARLPSPAPRTRCPAPTPQTPTVPPPAPPRRGRPRPCRRCPCPPRIAA